MKFGVDQEYKTHRHNYFLNMNDTVNTTTSDHPNLVTSIILSLIIICFYGIGLFLHTKIILLSKKEKDLTWKLDIVNSVFLLIYYGFSIVIHTMTYFIPNIYLITGEWLCYVSKFLLHYGLLYTTGHSMVIALLKYNIIVGIT